MAPRGYDRYMVQVGAGRNRKFVGFTDSERCAHFLGVLSIAAKSEPRGYLLVHDEPAGAAEVANEAGVTVRVARSAIDKLKRKGVLELHEGRGAWFVHDWDEINPPPKVDNTAAERQERYRNGLRARDGHAAVTDRNGAVTDRNSHAVTDRNVTPEVTPPEVEEEVETSEQVQRNARRTRKQVGQPDQTVVPVSLPDELRPAVHVVLPILQAVHEARGGWEPTVRGVGLAVAAYPDRDHADVARSVEHWLISGNGRNAECGDVVARFRRFLKSSSPASRLVVGGRVVPISSTVARMNEWQNAPEYREKA